MLASLTRPESIRPAQLRDLASIRRLQSICFGADGYGWLTLFSLFMSPHGIQRKAVVDDVLVGFVAAEFDAYDRCGWVITICVLPQHRSRGIGASLLRTVESELCGPPMRLTVRSGNKRAIHLYQRLGYERSGIRSRYYADGEDGWVMEKPLSHRA